jgi:hypothetical protein
MEHPDAADSDDPTAAIFRIQFHDGGSSGRVGRPGFSPTRQRSRPGSRMCCRGERVTDTSANDRVLNMTGWSLGLSRPTVSAAWVSVALTMWCANGGWVAMARAGDDPLDRYVWQNRIVVVIADSGQRRMLERQHRMLAEAGDGWLDRDLVVITIVDDLVEVDGTVNGTLSASDLRRTFDGSVQGFRVLLIGKDGGVKRRSDAPVGAERLFAVIDAMPMRRQEMRTRSR